MLFDEIKPFLLSLIIALIFQTGISTHPAFGGNNFFMKDLLPETFYNRGSKSISNGYRAIARYGEGFVAAGSGGRIDWITVYGKIIKSEKIGLENFNCLATQYNVVVVAGDHGTIFVSSEKGTFRKINSSTDRNINTIALFKSEITACTDNGEIVSGDENGPFRKVHLAIKGNIVSVSARNGDCFGVTDEGEIIQTADGTNWNIFDFNQFYKGFYKKCSFTNTLATEKGIAIAGVDEDGSPVFFFSTMGKVWSERLLVYKNGLGIQELLTGKPTGIFYDKAHDTFYLVCNGGKIMKLPSCSHCNELAELSAKFLTGISGMNEMLMVIGDGFYLKTIDI